MKGPGIQNQRVTQLPHGRAPSTACSHHVAARSLPSALVLCFLAAMALCQSDWHVDVLIPDTISVGMPTQEIAFGITHDDYPPPSFPARYPATTPDGGVLAVSVFSSAEQSWSLLLEIPDMVAATGLGMIPASQVLFRVNDGLWTRGTPQPQVIYTSVGPTVGWLELSLEFQLELVGDEPPGGFSVTTRLTALTDGQGP